MRFLLLGLVLAGPLLPGQTVAPASPPQGLDVQAPVFRSGTYVVPVGITLNYNGKPWVGLTAADFVILLDKVELTPLDVVPEEHAPNRYTLFFQPADRARDGKPHTLQVKVKRPNSKNWTVLPFKTSITLPPKGPSS